MIRAIDGDCGILFVRAEGKACSDLQNLIVLAEGEVLDLLFGELVEVNHELGEHMGDILVANSGHPDRNLTILGAT